MTLYGSSHALVIGIDRYTGGWQRLRKVVTDARTVTGELGLNIEEDESKIALTNAVSTMATIKDRRQPRALSLRRPP